jgi:hypothetical protein
VISKQSVRGSVLHIFWYTSSSSFFKYLISPLHFGWEAKKEIASTFAVSRPEMDEMESGAPPSSDAPDSPGAAARYG